MELLEIDFDNYLSEDGYQLCRESKVTIDDHEYHNAFVYRNPDGKILGANQYRYNIVETFGLKLIYDEIIK